MKAAAFASIMAVSLAGVACSEKAPAEAETQTPETTSETAQAERGQFNLRYPANGSPAASSETSSQFNLRTPDSVGSDAGQAFRLPEGAVRDNALSDIQEIRTPDMVDSEPEATDPDDDIIRLD